MDKINEAKMDGTALIQMYQAGYLDGVNRGRNVKKQKFYRDIVKDCKKAFEFRFVNKIQSKLAVRKVKNG